MNRKSSIPRSSIARSSMARNSIARNSLARPSTTSRPSIQGGRLSTVGGAAKVDVKANSSSNIKNILNFLMERDYPHPITKKNLTHPTETTFKQMLSFIIKDIYPDFECKNVSLNVIQLMSSLKYPYNLKESHFKPVGSPHSWPHLLELLSWLCEMVKFNDYESKNISQLLTIESKNDEEAEFELNHILMRSKLYLELIEQSRSTEEIQEKYIDHLNLKRQIDLLKSEESMFQQKIQEFRQKNSSFADAEQDILKKIEIAKQELDEKNQDNAQFQGILEKAQENIKQLQETLADKNEKGLCLADTIDQLAAENKQLSGLVDDQPPALEVLKIQKHFNNLKEEKTVLEKNIKDLVNTCNDRDVKNRSNQLKVKETWCDVMTELKTYVPVTECNINGPVTNKHVNTLVSAVQHLTDMISLEREEIRLQEKQIFDSKMQITTHQDDLRFSSETLVYKERQLEEKENVHAKERATRISESELISRKIEAAQKELADLSEGLKSGDSLSNIQEKVSKLESLDVEIQKEYKKMLQDLPNMNYCSEDETKRLRYKYQYVTPLLSLLKPK